jgi:hypothetical protein
MPDDWSIVTPNWSAPRWRRYLMLAISAMSMIVEEPDATAS